MSRTQRAVSRSRRVDFHGLSISYDDQVLTPREWTARQSWWAADLAAEAPAGPILELCAGAGHIGLLAARLCGRALVCVDANPVAASYCRANAEQAGLGDVVEVREQPIAEAVREGETFPLVIADPPWVPTQRTGEFPEDPRSAIDGGFDGLGVARACVAVIDRALAPGGSALLQLGTPDQAHRLRHYLTDRGLQSGELREYERGVVLRLDRPG